jgi:hypothetical protein
MACIVIGHVITSSNFSKDGPKSIRRAVVHSSQTEQVLLVVLSLPLVPDTNGLFSSLDTAEDHGSEGRAHAVGAIHLGEFHATNDQAGDDLAGALDNSVFSSAHVETAHATELGQLLHGDKTLDTEGTKRTIVAGGGDDQRCVDGVGVHAGLV